MNAEELAKNNKDYWYGRIQEIGNTNPALLSEEIINHLQSQIKELQEELEKEREYVNLYQDES